MGDTVPRGHFVALIKSGTPVWLSSGKKKIGTVAHQGAISS